MTAAAVFSFCPSPCISEDRTKLRLAASTAMISLMTAAAAMVPCRMETSFGSGARELAAMEVKTRETPE